MNKFLIAIIIILAAIVGYLAFQKTAVEEILPVPAEEEPETMTVKAFFNNNLLDPEFSCNKVFPVSREVDKTEAVAKAALEELLQGPTEEEKESGFFTSINEGVTIKNLSVAGGVARVEFDEQLEFQVGGSCRVTAIRAQITETLKQFPTVEEVVISVNGRIEDILQP